MANTTKFFVPQVSPRKTEPAYQAMVTELKQQFKWPITDRRISELVYMQDKRVITARVGELEQFENRYRIVAILESSIYMVVTRDSAGNPGPLILVSDSDISTISDFS